MNDYDQGWDAAVRACIEALRELILHPTDGEGGAA